MSASWYVGVDIGGTFTDVVAVDAESGALHHLKVPSSRSDPAAGFVQGLTTLREEIGVRQSDLRLLLHGTTLATNAIIERRLASTALVTTQGFRDVLEIGRHWRDELYDPFLEYPEPLVSRELRFEVKERIDAAGTVVEAVDHASAGAVVQQIEDANVEAVAVVFLHSYRNPAHEEEVAALLRARNGWFVCGSAELSRELREYERTSTTVMNAALMPLIDTYLTRLETGLAAAGSTASLFVTQSNGGALTPAAARARPVTLALSGPVAGVVACGRLARTIGSGDLICFDMGGTSADVSIISDFEPRMSSELKIGDLPMRLPAVHVHSIGAGGGSLASLDVGGALRVGPESAGSEPGPACYGRGGTAPTVTDCQLLLGRLTDRFPLAGRLGLDPELASAAIEPLANQLGMSNESTAAGVIEVVNAAMEGAVRVALRSRGDDPRDFALVAFGGAGPLHAAELARRLSVGTVIVPPHPGTLSALGLLTADVRLDFAVSELHSNGELNLAEVLVAGFRSLAAQAQAEVESDEQLRFARTQRRTRVTFATEGRHTRYGVTDVVFKRFHELHLRTYGFSSPADECEVVTMRLVATIGIDKPPLDHIPRNQGTGVASTRSVFMPDEGVLDAAIYERNDLVPGISIRGPAVIHQADSTTLVPSYAEAQVDQFFNLVLTIDTTAP